MFKHLKTRCLNHLDLKNLIARQDVAIRTCTYGIVKSVSNGQIVEANLWDVIWNKSGKHISIVWWKFNCPRHQLHSFYGPKGWCSHPFQEIKGPCQDVFVTLNTHARGCQEPSKLYQKKVVMSPSMVVDVSWFSFGGCFTHNISNSDFLNIQDSTTNGNTHHFIKSWLWDTL